MNFKKLKQTAKALLIIVMVINFFSCKDKNEPVKTQITSGNSSEDRRIEKLISSNEIVTNIVVTTVDEQGEFIGDVNLQVGIEDVYTDAKGRIIIENVEVNEDFVMIKASKGGYEVNKKTITPSKNGLTIVEIMLMADQPSQSMNAVNGGELVFGSVKMDFPQNAIISEDGTEYTGTVNVNTVYHNPKDENFANTQPGTLVGVTDGNELTALISEGMLTVDLTDGAGNSLNVSSDSKVKITMPASPTGPISIPLWHMNEKYGVWTEAGIATKVGDVYEFEVSHFSSYNLDWKTDAISEFCVTFKDEKGNLITNQKVYVNYLTYVTRVFTTDNEGQICFRNAPVTNYGFSVDLECDNFSSESISISQSGDYQVSIDFSNSNEVTYFNFSGTLTFCNDQLARDKSFTIELFDKGIKQYIFGYTDSEGNYSIQALFCDVALESYSASVHVFDDGFEKINDFELDLSQPNFTLDLKSCGLINGLSDETIIPIPDEYLLNILNERLSLSATGGIRYGDLLRLNYLELSDSINIDDLNGIEDFEGLQYCINLTSLRLSFVDSKESEDLEFIKSLTNLNDLSISRVNFSDLSLLSDLNKLEYLSFESNDISDFSPLYGLINLRNLYIWDNSPALTQSQKDELNNALPNTNTNF